VVQDIFMTETAWLADVILPATAWPEKTGTVSNTDRMVQLGQQAVTRPARPGRTSGSSSRSPSAWA
jgi:formate dehydrogenase major subunit